MMKKLFGILTIVCLLALASGASFAQQMEKPQAKEGQGMMGGMEGMSDPKVMGQMMEMRGEMMMKMGEVMMKHGKMMQKEGTK